MITQDEARARVARGAALLDERRPGWFNEVNIDQLNLATCSQCMLGQLYGDFWIGVQQQWSPEVAINDLACDSHAWREAQAHGFVLMHDEVKDNYFSPEPSGYIFLKDAWLDAIATRLTTVQPVTLEEVPVYV